MLANNANFSHFYTIHKTKVSNKEDTIQFIFDKVIKVFSNRDKSDKYSYSRKNPNSFSVKLNIVFQ